MSSTSTDRVLRARDDVQAHSRPNRFGELRTIREYFTSPEGMLAFSVTMSDGDTVRPHFHPVDQFQVFLGDGDVVYQRTTVPRGSVLVHYSDAYTTYGPIRAQGAAIEFFTLRSSPTSQTAYMPEDRAKLIRRGWRNVHGVVTPENEIAAGDISQTTVIESDKDRLGAYVLHCGAGATALGPSSDGAGRQYYCVIRGSVEIGGRAFGPRSLGFVMAGDPPLRLTGMSNEGAQILVLQFPAPRSDVPEGRREGRG